MMKRRRYLRLTFALGAATILSPISCINENPVLSAEDQRTLLASLADTVLPDTDVSGALKAGVPAYIAFVLENIYTPRDWNRFNRGLREIQAFSLAQYGLPFERCLEATRIQILTYFEGKAGGRIGFLNKIYQRIWGEPFILELKRFVVNGYCTSQLGATEGLAYDPIPVHYEACIPLANQPRAWATE